MADTAEPTSTCDSSPRRKKNSPPCVKANPKLPEVVPLEYVRKLQVEIPRYRPE